MAFSLETSAKIQMWRQKAAAGTLTLEEQKEIIETLRQDRVGASISSTKSRTAKADAKKPIDTGALLGDLMKGKL